MIGTVFMFICVGATSNKRRVGVCALNALEIETKDFLCVVDLEYGSMNVRTHGQKAMIACQCRKLEPINLFDTSQSKRVRTRVTTLSAHRHHRCEHNNITNGQKWGWIWLNRRRPSLNQHAIHGRIFRLIYERAMWLGPKWASIVIKSSQWLSR